jgi:thiol-disulfide isomerase/thioredoxin
VRLENGTAAGRRRRGTAARAVAAALVLVACAGCRGRTDAAPAAAGPTVAAAGSALPELRPATTGELRAAIAAPGASAVLVNVWATWCLPCRKEFPDLLRAAAEYRGRGLRLVLVSADFEDNADAARAFLARHGVDFPSYLKTGADMEFIDALSPQWSGALPATFIYDGAGALRDSWEGETPYESFAARIRAVVEAGSAGGTKGGER